jgi:cell division protein FtsN
MTSRTDRRPARAAAAKRQGSSRKSGFGGTLLGLFIGIALGLALAAGVAFYLTRAANPYQSTSPGKELAREAIKEASKPGRADATAADKPRFDFYKILPGVEEPKIQPKAVDRGTADRATVERAISPEKALAKADERAPAASDRQPAKVADRYWLQAGSFASEADAENLKARLAFAGWVATIQSATLPDKGVRYRVRLGPYDTTYEMNRMKTDLGTRGFDVSVIKN